jgi:hypothetical protein
LDDALGYFTWKDNSVNFNSNDRKVIYIDVGNMNADEAMKLILKMKQEYHQPKQNGELSVCSVEQPKPSMIERFSDWVNKAS